MKLFWEQAILWHNLPLTILMGVVIVFWTLSLVSAIDLDLDGFDLDLETETEIGDGGGGSNVIGTLLKFVNAQDVPLMMILSLLTLFMWVLSIILNYFFNPAVAIGMVLILLLVNFIVSVLLLKMATQPLRPLFRAIKQDEKHEPIIGSVGKVKSVTIDDSFGQVIIPRDKAAPALLNAHLSAGTAKKGDTILILSYDEHTQKYLCKCAPELAAPIFKQ